MEYVDSSRRMHGNSGLDHQEENKSIKVSAPILHPCALAQVGLWHNSCWRHGRNTPILVMTNCTYGMYMICYLYMLRFCGIFNEEEDMDIIQRIYIYTHNKKSHIPFWRPRVSNNGLLVGPPNNKNVQ